MPCIIVSSLELESPRAAFLSIPSTFVSSLTFRFLGQRGGRVPLGRSRLSCPTLLFSSLTVMTCADSLTLKRRFTSGGAVELFT